MNFSTLLKLRISTLRVLQSRPLSIQASPKLSFDEEWKNAKPLNQIPKLSPFQFIRRMIPGGKFHGLGLLDVHKNLKKEMGDITMFPAMFGRPQIIVAYNPEDYETVFRNEGIYPLRHSLESLAYCRQATRPDIYEKFGSVATENGENWHKTRTLVNPIMMKPLATKIYVPKIDEIAKEFIDVMKKVRDDKLETPANFSDLVNQWSLESIACIILDQRLGLLRESNKDTNGAKLIQLIRQFFVLSYEFEVNPSIWKYYHTKLFKEYMHVCDQMIELFLSYVNDAIQKLENQPPKEENEQSVLEKLLKIDKKLAVVMCSDALNAGVDTTASALQFTLYCIAKNQEKQEKLREEILNILPNKDDVLTVENMKNLPYLRAVIKEGLRMYNPAIGTMRTTENDMILSGYQISKGQQILILPLISSNEEKHFKMSQEFIPERWLRNNDDAGCPHAKDAHPFSYLPFGFGARMCVGRRFAELELEALLARIVRNFKVEWHYPDVKVKGVLVNVPESDMKFKLIDL